MRLQGTAPWTNAEDEILKAAVMKYGLQQWGRIASLFSKRTAKMCKSRWVEWLDPQIRKTEWSRDEDEKLLHLAKLMPTQWRTIAPIIGRTATQCLERYEQLLDMAAGDQPRPEGASDKLTETLPAKPDAVDMEEEELEMLSEARARLANTLGKKAKRKARERQLAEARRISLLQRRRELKATGLTANGPHLARRKRPRKNSDAEEIDYVKEVPFELLAPKGPHDIASELQESRRRAHDEELRKKKLAKLNAQKPGRPSKRPRTAADKLAQGLAGMMALEQQRAAEALAVSRSRPDLSLPAPLVSDRELEDVARVVATGGSMQPPPVPRRDAISEEARNQLARERMDAPLAGGERAVMSLGTGFAGAAPIKPAVSSLESLASRRTFVAGGAKSVIVRDELGINRVENEEEVIDAEALADGAAKLADGFKSLPAPEYEYQVAAVVRQDADDPADADAVVGEDAGARDRRLEAEADVRRQRKLAKRPLAVQLNLPSVPRSGAPSLFRSEAERLVFAQVEQMLDERGEDSVEERVVPDPAVTSVRVEAWPEERPEGLQQLRARFAAARRAALELGQLCDAAEARLETELGSWMQRSRALAQRAHALLRDVAKAQIELACYSQMHEQEVLGGPARLRQLVDEVQQVASEEADMQREWEGLMQPAR